MHLNIQYLSNKILELDVVLSEIKPEIVCLSEHGLKSNEIVLVNINGYSLITHFCREYYKGGGVAIFANNNSKIKVNAINSHFVEEFCEEKVLEFCLVSLMLENVKIFLLSLYRSPSCSVQSFLENLDKIISKLPTNKNKIILGDFNINTAEETNESRSLKDMLLSHNLSLCIHSSTRETSHSKTIIDNIATDLNEDFYEAGVVKTYISDHHCQIMEILGEVVNIPKNEQQRPFIYFRDYNEKNIDVFLKLLKEESWNDIYQSQNIDDIYESFFKILTSYKNQAFPLKRKKMSRQKKNKWITHEVKTAKNSYKDAALLYKKYETDTFKNLLKQKKQEYKKVLNTAKAQYVTTQISNSDNLSKTTWNLINNEVGNRSNNRNKSNSIIKIKTEDAVVDDPVKIANIFNAHYVSVAEKIQRNKRVQKLEYCNDNFYTPSNSMYLNSVSETEVMEIIRSLKNKKSEGHDEFSNWLIKKCNRFICKPLTFIINKCFELGVFPSNLKIVKVIPLFKKNDREHIENYRPVSVVSTFSKILEKALETRISTFFNKYNLLCDNQHGFIKGKSTETAFVTFVNKIIGNLDNKKHSVATFIDLSKAFDTVKLSILLDKLHKIGIRGRALNLLQSYLLNRTQYVELNHSNGNFRSELREVEYGVPQGSVLGPLLFNVYINGIKSSILEADVTLYADDTTILNTAFDSEQLEINSYLSVNNICQWFNSINLELNLNKTVRMTFSNSVCHVGLLVDDEYISEVEVCKFLGIHLDSKLNWQFHVDEICTKLSSVIFIIKTLSRYCTFNILKCIYFSLFECHLRYGITVWGNSSERNVKKIFTLQKRAIRCMFKLNRYQSCRNYFKTYSILTFPSLYIYQTILTTIDNNSLPTNSNIHNHRTRSADNYHLPSVNLTIAKKNPFYQGITFFNKLPDQIKTIKTNKNRFKVEIKKYLIKFSFYSIEEYMENSI
jgi:hypothetical protein